MTTGEARKLVADGIQEFAHLTPDQVEALAADMAEMIAAVNDYERSAGEEIGTPVSAVAVIWAGYVWGRATVATPATGVQA